MPKKEKDERFSKETLKKLSSLFYYRYQYSPVSNIIIRLLMTRPFAKSSLFAELKSNNLTNLTKEQFNSIISRLENSKKIFYNEEIYYFVCSSCNELLSLNSLIAHAQKTNHLSIEIQREVHLTLNGKLQFLQEKYNVSFLELCILLEIYHYMSIMPKLNKSIQGYPKFNFIGLVEDAVPSQRVSDCITKLVRKNLIYHAARKTIIYSIMPEIKEDLSQYCQIVKEFHDWFIETVIGRKKEIIEQDPLVKQRIIDNFPLFKKFSTQ